MRKPQELKLLADKVNEKARKQNEKVLARSIKENIKYLEKAVEDAAARGKYETMSDNLCHPRYRDGSSYSLDEMEDLLRDALVAHFEPLGFHWEGKGCNYLTLKWGEEKK